MHLQGNEFYKLPMSLLEDVAAYHCLHKDDICVQQVQRMATPGLACCPIEMLFVGGLQGRESPREREIVCVTETRICRTAGGREDAGGEMQNDCH